MKTRFTTLDICAVLSEIKERAVGLRLTNVYDIDQKTYLFKLTKTDQKEMLLIESGIRIHLSEFDWPKNPMPSGFSMKMRKHLRNRRLVSIDQLGMDRIVDLQFGSDDAAYHLIIELYDRGNIVLTDCNYVILNLLRRRKTVADCNKEENDDVRLAVHEPYPVTSARQVEPTLPQHRLLEILNESKEKQSIVKRLLNPHLPYGISTIEHILCKAGFSSNVKLDEKFAVYDDGMKIHAELRNAENLLHTARTSCCKGYLLQKKTGEMLTNVEFHPFLFEQHNGQPVKSFDSFNKAVDEFFGMLEAQKSDMKVAQREKQALKKLENVRKDHEARITGLRQEQDSDRAKAAVIEANLQLVDQAIKVICGAIANQVDWSDINQLIADAQARGDPVASAIRTLKLDTNTVVMSLCEPHSESSDSDGISRSSSDEDERMEEEVKNKKKPIKIELDLSLTAHGNAQRYYTMKRHAANKEQRTIDASEKAVKSAEQKTHQSLKEASTIHSIQKARKVYWFEKFLWFISTENYLVLGGRDAQQNEILVKKYLRAGDVYVHADLHGATSCIIKNHESSRPIPPKTVNEAGTMAICHSAAWDARVITSAWWVRHDQVSKTAPSGEYLTTGSFLIRGKKNYLPPSYLVYGFGFLFKVDESCVWKHKDERKVRTATDDGRDDVIDDGTTQVNDVINGEADTADVADDVTNSSGKQDDDDATVADDLSDSDDDVIDEPDDEDSKGDDVIKEKSKGDDVIAEQSESNDVIGELDDVKGQGDDVTDEEKPGQAAPPSDDKSYYPDTEVKIEFAASANFNEEPQTDTRRHLSAKQRRELRKQKKKGDTLMKSPGDDDVTARPVRQEKQIGKPQEPQQQQQQPKRGQKNKQRIMKQKYKDQDDEDRQIAMEILQSDKGPKEKDKKGKGKNAHKHQGSGGQQQQRHNDRNKRATVTTIRQIDEDAPQQQKSKSSSTGEHATSSARKTMTSDATTEKLPEVDSDEDLDVAMRAVDLVEGSLSSLTGSPHPDDILLFAVPVCAPYNVLQNYKFKVKLTPGIGKKGKATKTALSMFQMARDTTQQEKNHLRSVKDHDLSRNMPGKVKVSAPNMQQMHKRNKAKKK